MRPLAEIGPYSAEDWMREDTRKSVGDKLSCPNCEHTGWYSPIKGRRPDGLERLYRACKVCGFWQEADGMSAPYRCVMTLHVCVGRVSFGETCGSCNHPGSLTWHPCARVVTRAEVTSTPYVCPQCRVALTEDHVVPWAVSAQ